MVLPETPYRPVPSQTLSMGGDDHQGVAGMRAVWGVVRLRRLLFVLFAAVALLLLFWQRKTLPLDYLPAPARPLTDRSTVPKWTWQCLSGRCERLPISSSPMAPMSLDTCNMLCDSTQLWPQPTGPVTLGSNAAFFSSSQVHFQTIATPSRQVLHLLEEAYQVFANNIRVLENPTTREASTISDFLIRVSVNESSDTYITLDSDESYSMVLHPEGDGSTLVATIHAKSFFGARHGLETLSQLIWSDDMHGNTLRILRAASVQDAPVFKYRGLMLDTSRNFFPVSVIKRMLDGMAASKLNSFHWHMTDSQSFPFLSDLVPQLAQYGAYSPKHVYTVNDVKGIVQYAKVRGIRVLIEIDAPGHAGSGWQWGPSSGLGDLALCIDQQPWQRYCGEPPCGQLNPRNNHTYDILEKLYSEIFRYTNIKDIFHIGGDEVNLDCWGQFFNETDLRYLWGEFTLRALDKVIKANQGHVPKVVVIWSSDLTKEPFLSKYIDKSIFAIQMWGGSTWPENYLFVETDYRIIVSHVDAWYLDCGFGSWRDTAPGACSPYKTWQDVYNHRPWGQEASLPKRLVLGGEACLWSEQVDPSVVDARLWPRGAALAERLWSDAPILDANPVPHDIYTRLQTHRERLVKRGLHPAPLWPKWCQDNPTLCLT